MAMIEGRPIVEMYVSIRLNEEEAAALDAIVGYGVDAFLRVFYEHLGRAYLEPYEAGVRSLFTSVREGAASVQGCLEKAKQAREVFNGMKVARRM